MNTDFGGSVILGNLDDFIAPSQACVNPIFTQPRNNSGKDDGTSTDGASASVGVARIEIESDALFATAETTQPDLIKSSAAQTAQVSLSDCLACSGCVTSAETVLVQNQSSEQFSKDLASPSYKARVVSISPASQAAVAHHLGISGADASRRLVKFFKTRFGVELVFDCSSAHNVALAEARAEFFERYRHHLSQATSEIATTKADDIVADQQAAAGSTNKRKKRRGNRSSGKRLPWVRPPVTKALSATEVVDIEGNAVPATKQASSNFLPMLTSECPGWICYAEKRHPESLPYVSTVKSAQEIMGTFVKTVVAERLGVQPHEVYHATVMPCYDKKLEASRNDFRHTLREFGRSQDADTSDGAGVREVDLVLTTTEVLDLMTKPPSQAGTESSSQLAEPSSSAVDSAHASMPGLLGVSAGPGPSIAEGGSGGYAEYIFRSAAKEFHGRTIEGPLEYVQGKNKDWREVVLEVEGKVVLRFALAYGFRNIQKVMRDIKRSRVNYDYVEVMACPSGCLNGGGQGLQANSSSSASSEATVVDSQSQSAIPSLQARFQEAREHRLQLHKIGRARDEDSSACEADSFVSAVYSELLRGTKPGSSAARQWLHTRYHTVPKMEESNPLGIRW